MFVNGSIRPVNPLLAKTLFLTWTALGSYFHRCPFLVNAHCRNYLLLFVFVFLFWFLFIFLFFILCWFFICVSFCEGWEKCDFNNSGNGWHLPPPPALYCVCVTGSQSQLVLCTCNWQRPVTRKLFHLTTSCVEICLTTHATECK